MPTEGAAENDVEGLFKFGHKNNAMNPPMVRNIAATINPATSQKAPRSLASSLIRSSMGDFTDQSFPVMAATVPKVSAVI